MNNLQKIANNSRIDIIDMIYNAKSGHPGGSLSIIDILIVLYHKEMNLNLDDKGQRIDKCVLSKGHASPALYATLASVGLLDKDLLKTFRKYDGLLEGHPSIKIPGVDVSSGSLGQGLSIANGMAIAKKIDNKLGYVYVILGDGELEEGQNWEAFMTINKYNLNNVIIFIDNNGLQIDGSIQDVKKLNNLNEKIASFGLNVLTCDGNNIDEIEKAISIAKKSCKPSCIIAKTIKGKGVSFMENEANWHGKSLTDDEYIQAKRELESKI
ncbi:MAG: transketolase [Clostridia bacterium]|nr:transketolase [Clostridia bacterium]MDD4387202.1 transketolase [Clostridia bacterium]